ncbi:acyl carrier protein [Geobacter sp. DSM 9736]|uniref:acyl carrier protein n=1 Tax=Geobacter sp. DSM 9736 TaxID=1277350 RepID=UPI000B50F79F|nr:acyl carrier protein [Geobacter sp. DSM 9736]SNB46036.1 acyl carrier protein [Geobacter sp. DSM 9736]
MNSREKIRHFVVDNFLFGEDSSLKWDTSFLDDGIVDSTGILELVAFLESEFGVRIADDELVPDNLDSINKVARFIDRKLGGEPLQLSPSLMIA